MNETEKINEPEDAIVRSYCEWWQEIHGFLFVDKIYQDLSEKNQIKATNKILEEVGIQKREQDRNSKGSKKSESSEDSDGPRPGVKKFLENNKDKNEFLGDLCEDLQDYGRLTKNQYNAIKGSVED